MCLVGADLFELSREAETRVQHGGIDRGRLHEVDVGIDLPQGLRQRRLRCGGLLVTLFRSVVGVVEFDIDVTFRSGLKVTSMSLLGRCHM